MTGQAGRSSGRRNSGSSPVDYAAVCAAASGKAVISGFRGLGPINGFGDTLFRRGGAVGERLAAEQISHLVEGWRYAAAATSAYLNNSKDSALHFAYYAELRSALSLLSWSGIRIARGGYFYLDVNGAKNVFPSSDGTHIAVWGIWKEWVNRGDAKSLIDNRVRICPGVSYGDVLRCINVPGQPSLLKSWGYDLLAVGAADRRSRNKASYEPLWSTRSLDVLADNQLGLVRDLWGLLARGNSGAVFDSALAVQAISSALPDMMRAKNKKRKECFELLVSDICNSTGVDRSSVLGGLEVGNIGRDVFSLASAGVANVDNVLCRAFFLLRVAMLALEDGVPSSAAASGWIKHWLEHAGLWSDSMGFGAADLDKDYLDALAEFEGVDAQSLWEHENLPATVKLSRPDACLAWNLGL